jgi:hypothetical protein
VSVKLGSAWPRCSVASRRSAGGWRGEGAAALGEHTNLAGLRAALTAAGHPVTSQLLRDTFRRLTELSDNDATVDIDQLVSEDSR